MTEILTLTPEKRYYKISEAARAAGVKPYVLRFWESEFPHIRPTRTRTGQRLYTRSDLDSILFLKKLLYDRKFTIPGAREYLGRMKAGESLAEDRTPVTLEEIAAELAAVRELLD
ncbi:MAG: MerR family transcriptional regulator [Proteobacteria bacterium]|nr:MerR family transcriptional regulator [Pseudomonadota bacterium]